jgi:hypothetical protein
VGRAIQDWQYASGNSELERPFSCRRIPLGEGVELMVDERHPLLRSHPDEQSIVDAFRSALAGLLPREPGPDER